MTLARRQFLAAAMAMAATPALAASGPTPAPSAEMPRDLTIACDLTLAGVMTELAGAFTWQTGIRAFMHPTLASLMVPQLQREVQNDILIATDAVLAQAVAGGVMAAPAPPSRWRNRLVLAGPVGGDKSVRRIAVTDALPDRIDGRAVLAKAGMQPGSVLGAASTREVVFLVTSGAAQAGVMTLSELRGTPGLELLRSFDDAPGLLYGAGISGLTRRAAPEAFLRFLDGPQAKPILAANGLEAVA